MATPTDCMSMSIVSFAPPPSLLIFFSILKMFSVVFSHFIFIKKNLFLCKIMFICYMLRLCFTMTCLDTKMDNSAEIMTEIIESKWGLNITAPICWINRHYQAYSLWRKHPASGARDTVCGQIKISIYRSHAIWRNKKARFMQASYWGDNFGWNFWRDQKHVSLGLKLAILLNEPTFKRASIKSTQWCEAAFR